MIVDGRVLRHQFDRTFEIFGRPGVVPEPEIGPTQTVDDVAVIGPQRHRAFHHLHGLVEMHPLVDPGIAQIIQHQRLFRRELQRAAQIGFGARPLLRALQRDAAAVIEPPILRLVLAEARERIVIGGDRFLEAVMAPEDVAEFDHRLPVVRPLGRHAPQQRHRVVGPVELIEHRRLAQPRRPGQRRSRIDRAVIRQRFVVVAELLGDLGDEQLRDREVRLEIEREPRVDQRDIERVAPLRMLARSNSASAAPSCAVSIRRGGIVPLLSRFRAASTTALLSASPLSFW